MVQWLVLNLTLTGVGRSWWHRQWCSGPAPVSIWRSSRTCCSKSKWKKNCRMLLLCVQVLLITLTKLLFLEISSKLDSWFTIFITSGFHLTVLSRTGVSNTSKCVFVARETLKKSSYPKNFARFKSEQKWPKIYILIYIYIYIL